MGRGWGWRSPVAGEVNAYLSTKVVLMLPMHRYTYITRRCFKTGGGGCRGGVGVG